MKLKQRLIHTEHRCACCETAFREAGYYFRDPTELCCSYRCAFFMETMHEQAAVIEQIGGPPRP